MIDQFAMRLSKQGITKSMSLPLYLATELTEVLGVLGDLHLLDLFT
jgi:hypothetical protein